MAVKQSIVVASVLLLVVFVEQGLAIKCFDCNSNVDIRCAVPYPSSEFIMDCELLGRSTGLTYTHCRKIAQIIKHELNQLAPDSRVIRECGSNITDIRTECFHRNGKSSIQSVCECDISYCNGTNATKVSATAIFIVSLIALLTSKIVNL